MGQTCTHTEHTNSISGGNTLVCIGPNLSISSVNGLVIYDSSACSGSLCQRLQIYSMTEEYSRESPTETTAASASLALYSYLLPSLNRSQYSRQREAVRRTDSRRLWSWASLRFFDQLAPERRNARLCFDLWRERTEQVKSAIVLGEW